MLIDTVELQKQIDKKINARYRRISYADKERKARLALLDSAYKSYVEQIEQIEQLQIAFNNVS